MGNRISIQGQALHIIPTGLDKLWTFKTHLTIPLAQVVGATADQAFVKEPKGIRELGLATFNKWAGTFSLQGQKSFYNVTSHQQVVVIQLRAAPYQRLVIGVADASQVADEVNQAIEVLKLGY